MNFDKCIEDTDADSCLVCWIKEKLCDWSILIEYFVPLLLDSTFIICSSPDDAHWQLLTIQFHQGNYLMHVHDSLTEREQVFA